MKDHGALKEALKRRKSNGVDVTIVLGGAEKPEEEKRPSDDQELAPEIKDLPQDQSLMMAENQKAETGHPDEQMDQELIRKMLAERGDTQDNMSLNSIGGKARALMKSKLKK